MEARQRRYFITRLIIDLGVDDDEFTPLQPEGGGPWELLSTHVVLLANGYAGFVWTWGEL